MHHELPLITTIAAALGLALVLGFLAARLRLPALVGYLVAGILIGPFTPGLRGRHPAGLAAGGDRRDAADVRRGPAFLPGRPAGRAQDRGAGRGRADASPPRHWAPASRCGGAGASPPRWCSAWRCRCASTVVLLRALEARGLLDTFNGRIAVGWLVVEDLAMVLVLVLLPPLAPVLAGTGSADPSALWRSIGTTLVQVSVFVAADAGGGAPPLPLGAVAGAARRLARTVHAVRGGGRREHRLRRDQALRRVLRPRRLLRRHGAARIAVQPSRGRGDAAAARRFRRAVLRLGGHAVRPPHRCSSSRCACWPWSASSSWASRSPPRSWCCCCAIRCTRR